MKIAINCRLLIPGKLEGVGFFTYELVRRWVKNHPQHEFVLIFDRRTDGMGLRMPNTKIIELFPSARHPVLYKIWLDYRIPGILKREKADLFFSPEPLCSLKWKGPTVITVHDLAYIHFPSILKGVDLAYRQKYVPRFLSRADHILTVSDFTRQDLMTRFRELEAPITVTPNGCRDVFRRRSQEEIEIFRNEYTAGRPYFFYYGALNARKNIDNLLRAFEAFKKDTKSDHLMVLSGHKGWKTQEMMKVYKHHAFRDDILFTGYLEDEQLSAWLSAATALTYVSKFEGFGLPVLEAMRSGVPVITSRKSSMEEVAGEHAFFVTPEYVDSIANRMKFVVEEPQKSAARVTAAYERSLKYNWDDTASAAFEVLLRTAE